MRCPKCNYNNLDGSAVCNLCGELLHSVGKNYYKQFRKVRRKTPASGSPPVKEEEASARPFASEDPHSLKYSLVCFPLDPVELKPDQSYTIGRSSENDIIFPVGQVSRKHSVVQWQTGRFVITDLDSHNGTFVNGENVTSRPLEHGDQIKIGPYLLEFYISRPGDVFPGVEAKAMEATQDLVLGEEEYEVGPFSGRLAEIELRDIARLLNMTRKTGKLEVKTPRQVGEIHFQEGEIVDARWTGMTPMQALAHMLQEKEGSFRFLRDAEGMQKKLEGPTSKLLIEAVRLGSRRR